MSKTARRTDVLIIGAGAAGLMCAIEAGKRGRSVALMDHSTSLGKKILISGGGRCNFTNLATTPDHFVSANPDFCKSALSRYTPHMFLEWVTNGGIRAVEKREGQLFCAEGARSLLSFLESECRGAGAEILLETTVRDITPGTPSSIETSRGDFECESLVIATGGLSVPKVGATDLGYRIAAKLGLEIIDLAPALDGFVFLPPELTHFKTLAGVALPASVSTGRKQFTDDLLFTHVGLSGPAALQASLYWNPRQSVTIDFLPQPPVPNLFEWLSEKKRGGSRAEPKTVLAPYLPKTFLDRFQEAALPRKAPLNELSVSELRAFAERLRRWTFTPAQTVGYAKAEVTRGGVDTQELSSQTMECRKVPGLYFIGEVVDVTGQLGGFNFQWAWSSGWAAGQHV